LLLPIIIVGSQMVFNGKLNSLSDWANTTRWPPPSPSASASMC
jgi:hypothetical protein